MATEKQNKHYAKCMNSLKKLFEYLPDKNEDDKIPSDKLIGYLDKTGVLMIIPKTYFLKTKLLQDFQMTESKMPDLKFNGNAGGIYQISFLNMIMPLLKNTSSEAFRISCCEEYPMILEVAEVKIIIAPYNNKDWE